MTGIERGGTPKEVETAEVLKHVIGGKLVTKRVGDWLVESRGGPYGTELHYFAGSGTGEEKALYGFFIKIPEFSDDPITLLNYHRKAEKGNGTPSLQSLEQSLVIVSHDLQRAIRLVFPAHGQQDTRRWLEKNNYISEGPDNPRFKTYYKDIQDQSVQ
ncbi:MAG TPA: hypothetical protein VE090_03965 [Methylomirabilota bacterium]|nr:hypothetical protein [Methylomirabilota bacterium]